LLERAEQLLQTAGASHMGATSVLTDVMPVRPR
jgi:hypothetical protein